MDDALLVHVAEPLQHVLRITQKFLIVANRGQFLHHKTKILLAAMKKMLLLLTSLIFSVSESALSQYSMYI